MSTFTVRITADDGTAFDYVIPRDRSYDASDYSGFIVRNTDGQIIRPDDSTLALLIAASETVYDYETEGEWSEAVPFLNATRDQQENLESILETAAEDGDLALLSFTISTILVVGAIGTAAIFATPVALAGLVLAGGKFVSNATDFFLDMREAGDPNEFIGQAVNQFGAAEQQAEEYIIASSNLRGKLNAGEVIEIGTIITIAEARPLAENYAKTATEILSVLERDYVASTSVEAVEARQTIEAFDSFFAAGLAENGIRIANAITNALGITSGSSGDTEAGASAAIDELKAVNVEVLFATTASDIETSLDGLRVGDSNLIEGTASGETIIGSASNDHIYASGGNDTIVSSDGTDVLYGDGGNDRYVYGNGWGTDHIHDAFSNTIEFTEASYSDLNFSRSGRDLVITRSGSEDTITVNRFFIESSSNQAYSYTFIASGESRSATEIIELIPEGELPRSADEPDGDIDSDSEGSLSIVEIELTLEPGERVPVADLFRVEGGSLNDIIAFSVRDGVRRDDSGYLEIRGNALEQGAEIIAFTQGGRDHPDYFSNDWDNLRDGDIGTGGSFEVYYVGGTGDNTLRLNILESDSNGVLGPSSTRISIDNYSTGPSNSAPVLSIDQVTQSTPSGERFIPEFTVSDSDGDTTTLEFRIVSSSGGGRLNSGANTYGLNQTVEVSSAALASGSLFLNGMKRGDTYQIEVRAKDGFGESSWQTITVNVSNGMPTARQDAFSVVQDSDITIDQLDLTRNDSDPDGSDSLTVTSVSSSVGGTANLGSDGSIRFTPDPDFTGAASFEYTVSDGNGGLATTQALVQVLSQSELQEDSDDGPTEPSEPTDPGNTIADGGDSFSDPVPIELPISFDQSVGGSDPDDYFSFTAENDDTITVSLTGLSADVDLHLYNTAGARVAESRTGGNVDESFTYEIVAGVTYILGVTPTATASSSYSVSISLDAVVVEEDDDDNGMGGTASLVEDEDFAGDVTSTAELEIGGTANGSIDPVRDKDWYQVNLQEGVEHTITAVGDASNASALSAPAIIIRTESGGFAAQDDNAAGADTAQVVFTPDSSGVFWISVRNFTGATGDYEVSITGNSTGVPEPTPNPTPNPVPPVIDLPDPIADFPPADFTDFDASDVPGPEIGQIESPSELDYFKVSLTGGQVYIANLQISANFNGVPTGDDVREFDLNVFDSSGQPVDLADKYFHLLQSNDAHQLYLIFVPPEDGDYYLQVSKADETGDTTQYFFNMWQEGVFGYPENPNPTDDPLLERAPNATFPFEEASIFERDGSVVGQITPVEDTDFFKLILEGGEEYEVRLRLGPQVEDPTNIDLELFVYAANGEAISASSVTSTDSEIVLTFTAPDDGLYFIEVGQSSENEDFVYILDLDQLSSSGVEVPAPSSFESDDIPDNTSTTETITLGTSVVGLTDSSSTPDEDWYRFEATEGENYVVSLSGYTEDGNPLSNPLLFIYNQDGIFQSVHDVVIRGSDYLFSASYTGTYYLSTRGLGSNSGDYIFSVQDPAVTVEDGDDHADSSITAAEITSGQSINGSIETGGDVDWIRVVLPGNSTQNITLDSSNISGAVRFEWFSQSSTFLSADSQDVYGLPNDGVFTIENRFDADRIYYFAVDGVGRSTGNYSVSVSPAEDIPDDFPDQIYGGEPIVVDGSLTINGTSEVREDADFVTLRLSGGSTYRIVVDASPATNVGVLYSGDWYNWQSIGGPSGTDLYVAETQDYVVQVGGFPNWEISIEEISGGSGDGNNQGSNTNDTFTNEAASGAIDFFGDEDWYRIELTADQTYRISSESSNIPFQSNITIEIVDAQGEHVAGFLPGPYDPSGSIFQQHSPFNTEEVTFTPAQTGEYFVVVRNGSNFSSSYNYGLQVTEVEGSLTPVPEDPADGSLDEPENELENFVSLPSFGQTEANTSPIANDDFVRSFPDRVLLEGNEFTGNQGFQDTVFASTLLSNDSDRDFQDTLRIVSVQNVSSGATVELKSDGDIFVEVDSVSLTSQEVSFDYTIQDESGAQSSASATVLIFNANGSSPFGTNYNEGGSNQAPIARNIEYTFQKGSSSYQFGDSLLLVNVFDIDGDEIEIVDITALENIEVDWDSSTGIIIVRPLSSDTSSGSFRYTVSDGEGHEASAIVNLSYPDNYKFDPALTKDLFDQAVVADDGTSSQFEGGFLGFEYGSFEGLAGKDIADWFRLVRDVDTSISLDLTVVEGASIVLDIFNASGELLHSRNSSDGRLEIVFNVDESQELFLRLTSEDDNQSQYLFQVTDRGEQVSEESAQAQIVASSDHIQILDTEDVFSSQEGTAYSVSPTEDDLNLFDTSGI